MSSTIKSVPTMHSSKNRTAIRRRAGESGVGKRTVVPARRSLLKILQPVLHLWGVRQHGLRHSVRHVHDADVNRGDGLL
eukprot:7050261-Pyramimonas_sp.AAC.1